MGGVLWAYGNQQVAPYSEQFYIGGANSLRAFTVRSIGPGTYNPGQNTKYGYLDQTGDVKLEANVEYRFPIFGDLYGATFLDSGLSGEAIHYPHRGRWHHTNRQRSENGILRWPPT